MISLESCSALSAREVLKIWVFLESDCLLSAFEQLVGRVFLFVEAILEQLPSVGIICDSSTWIIVRESALPFVVRSNVSR